VRVDAQRKYDRILEVATEVIVEQGTEASLNEVAKRAGVGPGTLYRHFPTREALIDAIAKNWMERIEASGRRAVTGSQPPRERLLSWFEDVVAQISHHSGFPGRLVTSMDNKESALHHKCEILIEINARVLDHLSADGAIRGGATSSEICRLVLGVAVVADQGKLSAEAIRSMLTIVASGLTT
jgi:AcrR family transcriptional regulator